MNLRVQNIFGAMKLAAIQSRIIGATIAILIDKTLKNTKANSIESARPKNNANKPSVKSTKNLKYSLTILLSLNTLVI